MDHSAQIIAENVLKIQIEFVLEYICMSDADVEAK